MSDAEWSDQWKPIQVDPTRSAAGGFDFLEELWRNVRKRVRVALAVCDNWPRGHKEWDITCLNHSTVRYGTIGTVSTDGTTITITDATSPSLAMLIDGSSVKRWVGWAPGYFDGVHLDGTNNEPGAYYIVLDVDDPHARNVYKAIIKDTTQSGGAGSFTVADDGSLSLNRTLSSFEGKRYTILTTAGQTLAGTLNLSWADRWPRYPVWTNDSGSVAVILTGTGTSGSSTAKVEDSSHDADALWPTLNATMSVKLTTATGPPATYDYRPITTSTIPPATTHAEANVAPSFSASPSTKPYSIISSTTTTLTDATKSWTVDMHAGADLIGYVAGRIVRVPIDSNTATTLTFTEQTVPPEGNYWITKSGAWWGFDENGTPSAWQPFKWYTGNLDSNYTHYADDSLAPFATLATVSVKVRHGGPDEDVCTEITDPDAEFHVLDDDITRNPDVHFDTDDHCGAADLMLSPFIYRSPRMIQYVLESIATLYLLDFKLDADGTNIRSEMSLGWLPALMKKVGGSYDVVTLTAQDGSTATFSGTISPPDGETTRSDATWVVTDANGLALPGRVGGGTINYAASTITGTWTGDDVTLGRKVEITLGWDRSEPRRVSSIYPRVIFEPYPVYNEDTGEIESYSGAVTQNQPGQYNLTAPSVTCAVYDITGRLSQGRVLNADLTGQRFRYIGSNRGDPTAGTTDPTTVGGVHDTLFPDAGCVCLSAPVAGVQKMWMQGDTTNGVVSSATSTSITCDGANLECSLNARITHTGTASADGSTTTLTDTVFSTAFDTYYPFFPYTIWLSLGAYGARFVGMFLQRETAVGSGIFEKRLIVDQSDRDTGTLTVSPAFTGATVTGMAWKIAEPAGAGDGTGPGVQDFWAGATLRVTKASDGTNVDFVVTHHDQDTFAFTAGSYTPLAGDTWKLIYFRPGDVLEWDGTKFVAVDMGPYAPVIDYAALEPTCIQQRGRWRKGDRPLANDCRMLQQLKDVVEVLHRTVTPSTYNDQGENNNKLLGDTADNAHDWHSTAIDWGEVKALYSPAWTALTAFEANTPPSVMSAILANVDLDAPETYGSMTYNYLTASPFKCPRFGLTTRQVQMWIYFSFDPDNSDIGTITSHVTGPPAGDYYEIREFNADQLQVTGTGGTGATAEFRKWVCVYDNATSDATVAARIGDNSLPLPELPSVDPTVSMLYDSVLGHSNFTRKGAYALQTFAVVDWQDAFDAMT